MPSREPSDEPSGPARPVARLVVRVSPSDVGSRVSLRLRHVATTLTDVVGHLESWADGELAVRRRDGQVVRVPAADLVAGKVVPEAPVRRPPTTG
jgi:hypothetical protein